MHKSFKVKALYPEDTQSCEIKEMNEGCLASNLKSLIRRVPKEGVARIGWHGRVYGQRNLVGGRCSVPRGKREATYHWLGKSLFFFL